MAEELCPVCGQTLPHEFEYNHDDLRLEGGVPVIVKEMPVEVPTQPHNVAYNPDGSVSIKVSAMTFCQLHTSPGGITYLLVRAIMDYDEYHVDWHRINRLKEEQLTAPDLLKVENGIATFGPGKLGFSVHRPLNDAPDWVKVTLGLHVTEAYLLTDAQKASIELELQKIVLPTPTP